MTLLTATDISVSLQAQTLIENVSLRVNAGEVVAVIGPNGAGKTSLVRALTGELPTTSGEVWFNRCRIQDYSLEQRARQLAMLSQHTELHFPFAVSEVVQLGRIPHCSGLAEDRRIAEAALRAVDMTASGSKLYTQLSGGEKQRVQLARVLAQVWRQQDAAARLLILDEPTAALDASHTRQLMREINRMAASAVGVIMILHDFNLAARFADHIVVLVKGKKVIEGKPDEVFTEANMLRYFDVEAHIIPHPKTGRPLVFIDD